MLSDILGGISTTQHIDDGLSEDSLAHERVFSPAPRLVPLLIGQPWTVVSSLIAPHDAVTSSQDRKNGSMPLNTIKARDVNEFVMIEFNLGLRSMILASHGKILLISSYDNNVASVDTGAETSMSAKFVVGCGGAHESRRAGGVGTRSSRRSSLVDLVLLRWRYCSIRYPAVRALARSPPPSVSDNAQPDKPFATQESSAQNYLRFEID